MNGWQEAGEEGKWQVVAGDDVGCGAGSFDKHQNTKPDTVDYHEIGREHDG